MHFIKSSYGSSERNLPLQRVNSIDIESSTKKVEGNLHYIIYTQNRHANFDKDIHKIEHLIKSSSGVSSSSHRVPSSSPGVPYTSRGVQW